MSLVLGGPAALPAHAAERNAPGLELSWQAPLECPSAERVQHQVDALLPRDRSGQGRTLEAQARVTRAEDGGWLLHLTIISGGLVDARELVGDSCQALVDSVAVILALQLSPTENDDNELRLPAPVRSAAPAPAPVPSADRAQRASPRSRFVQLALSGTADSAALPRLALGGRVELGSAVERWYFGAGFVQWLRQEEALGLARSGHGHFGWRAGFFQVCHGTWGEQLRFGPCLGAELGQLSARSSNVRVPGVVAEPWVAALGGIGFAAPFGPHLSFTSSLQAVVPLRRPSFVIEGIGEIHQPRPIGVRSALGLAWRF